MFLHKDVRLLKINAAASRDVMKEGCWEGPRLFKMCFRPQTTRVLVSAPPTDRSEGQANIYYVSFW